VRRRGCQNCMAKDHFSQDRRYQNSRCLLFSLKAAGPRAGFIAVHGPDGAIHVGRERSEAARLWRDLGPGVRESDASASWFRVLNMPKDLEADLFWATGKQRAFIVRGKIPKSRGLATMRLCGRAESIAEGEGFDGAVAAERSLRGRIAILIQSREHISQIVRVEMICLCQSRHHLRADLFIIAKCPSCLGVFSVNHLFVRRPFFFFDRPTQSCNGFEDLPSLFAWPIAQDPNETLMPTA